MKKAGRSLKFILILWFGIMVISGASAYAGYAFFKNFSPQALALTTAVAAGAILTMISDTMIPEAFELAHDFAGLITVFGFLSAFALSKLTSG